MYVIDGELVAGLPAARRAPEGMMRTGLAGMTDSELAGIGVYPATIVKPALSEGQYYGAYAVEIEGDHATATYAVLDYSPAEIAGMLAGAKVAKKAEIAAARWAEMSEPATVDGYDALFYADKESLDDMNRASINLQRAIALGHKPENTMIEWKTANGTFVNLSLNDLITVELLLSQRQQELYTKESLLKTQIEASSTVNEVELLHW